jgi:hypothetical protein
MIVDLLDEHWWPPTVLRMFSEQRHVLLAHRGMDEVIRQAPFREAASELEEFLQPHSVIAYHCTKEPVPGHFREHGLRILDIRTHQEDFLRIYGSHFTVAEISTIRDAWTSYFTAHQTGARDRRLWVTFSIMSIIIGDADPLFTYLGGEAISMPLGQHHTIGPKLAALGAGVVVMVDFPAHAFRHASCVDHPLAFTSFCAAHRRINPQASCHGSEGWLEHGITPPHIRDVVAAEEFRRIHQGRA